MNPGAPFVAGAGCALPIAGGLGRGFWQPG